MKGKQELEREAAGENRSQGVKWRSSQADSEVAEFSAGQRKTGQLSKGRIYELLQRENALQGHLEAGT